MSVNVHDEIKNVCVMLGDITGNGVEFYSSMCDEDLIEIVKAITLPELEGYPDYALPLALWLKNLNEDPDEQEPLSKPYVDQLIYNRITELSKALREDTIGDFDKEELDQLRVDYPKIADSVAEAYYCFVHDC